MTSFFEISSPRHMFQKAQHDLRALENSLNAYTVFNFFVTAYHVTDYALYSGIIPESDVRNFRKDPDIAFARDICDKGKHLKLDKRPWRSYPDPQTAIWSSEINGAPINATAINSEESYVLLVDNKVVDIASLAPRVMEKLDQFLKKYGL